MLSFYIVCFKLENMKYVICYDFYASGINMAALFVSFNLYVNFTQIPQRIFLSW